MTVPMLHKLSLLRFRSFPAAELELDNPTFLVGQNGAGKSNVADAFAFLAEAMLSPLSSVLDRRAGLATVGYRSGSRGRRPDLGLRVELNDLDEETSKAVYAFQLRGLKDHDFKVFHEQCVVTRRNGPQNWFNRSETEWSSSEQSLVPALEPHALALPVVAGNTQFAAVWRFLSEMQVYRIEPAVLREMQDPDGGGRLRTDGSNAASLLREIRRKSPEDWQRICDLLGSVVPGTIDVEPKKLGNKLGLEFTQEFTQEFSQELSTSRPVKFEAYNMSDGTLRVLGLLAAVFQRPAPSALVIEEPEATIHPGALGSVLDLLRHAGRFTQTVVTTHSPDILDASWIEDRHLRIVGWNQGATRIAPVSEPVRKALKEHLMGAGGLMRSNALTAAEGSKPDPVAMSLFEELAE